MIKTNNLKEYAFLEMLRSCCENHGCECDNCPMQQVCNYSDITLTSLILEYDPNYAKLPTYEEVMRNDK